VRDAGGELADGREPVGALHVLLEPPQLGEVGEVHDAADHVIADVAQRRDRDAEREVAEREVGAPELAALRLGELREEAGHARLERLAVQLGGAPPEDVGGGLVRGEHGPVGRDRDEARRERAHDVLVQREQVGRGLPRRRERLGAALELIAEQEREHADGGQRRDLDAERAREVAGGLLPRPELRRHRHLEHADPGEQPDEGQRAERGERHGGGAAAVRQRAGRDDRQRVEERVGALRAAGDVDEQRRDREIGRVHRPRDLARREPGPQEEAEHDHRQVRRDDHRRLQPHRGARRPVAGGDQPQGQAEHDRDDERAEEQEPRHARAQVGARRRRRHGLADERVARRRRHRIAPDHRHRHRGAGALALRAPGPGCHQPRSVLACRVSGPARHGGQPPCRLPASLKIGRYIAMMSPPTTIPRNAIITGSISEVIADTDASTSSS
jgi:hypothetical protein